MTQSMLARSAYIGFLLLFGNLAEAQVDRYIDLDRDYKGFQVSEDGRWALVRTNAQFNRHYAIVDLNTGEVAHLIADQDDRWRVRALTGLNSENQIAFLEEDTADIEDRVRIVDIATSATVREIRGKWFEFGLGPCEWSPDGRFLAFQQNAHDESDREITREISILDLTTGLIVARFEGDDSMTNLFRFHPEKQQLLIGFDRKVDALVCWDFPTGNLQATTKGFTSSVHNAWFAEDGSVLFLQCSVGPRYGLCAFNPTTLRPVPGCFLDFKVVGFKPYRFSPSRGDKLIAAATRDRCAIVDISEVPYRLITSVTGHPFHGVQFDSEDQLLSLSEKQIVKWRYSDTLRINDQSKVIVRYADGKKAAAGIVRFAPDGRRVFFGHGSIGSRSSGGAATFQIIQGVADQIKDGQNPIQHSKVKPRTLRDGGYIWEFELRRDRAKLVQSFNGRQEIDGHFVQQDSDIFTDIELSSDGRWCGTICEGKAILFDLKSGAIVGRSPNEAFRDVAFSGDGKRIAALDEDGETISIFDTGMNSVSEMTLEEEANAIAFYDEQTIAADFSLYDIGTGTQTLVGSHKRKSLAKLAVGNAFLIGANDEVTRFDIESATVSQPFPVHRSRDEAVTSIAVHKKLLATGSKHGPIRIWNASTGVLMRTLIGHQQSVDSLDFSADGESLVSSSRDGTVRLWSSSSH